MSLLTIHRNRAGSLEISGRSWQEDGTLSARYWSEASKESVDPVGIFYFHRGERPRHPNAPEFEGTGQITLDSVDRANGYWTNVRSAIKRIRNRFRALDPTFDETENYQGFGYLWRPA